jgi:uncharacterized protein (DUF433 family)
MGHWKKPFKSDHLASSDIGDKSLVLTIEYVKQEICKSQSGDELANVAYFTDKKFKPMRLNVGNSSIVKKFAGNKIDTDDWKMILVEIYVDPKVRFGRETVEGLRIKPFQPKTAATPKPTLAPDSPNWAQIVGWVADGNEIGKVTAKYSITSENVEKLKNESRIRPTTNEQGQGTKVEN